MYYEQQLILGQRAIQIPIHGLIKMLENLVLYGHINHDAKRLQDFLRKNGITGGFEKRMRKDS